MLFDFISEITPLHLTRRSNSVPLRYPYGDNIV